MENNQANLKSKNFTISVRGKPCSQPILDFLALEFGGIALESIDSVFGFAERCTLYGGRPFVAPQLSDSDIDALYSKNIGFRIPLTNHIATKNEYEDQKWFLEKYHRPGNTAIVTNDNLARWIRRDFPDYQLEASVIKNIDTHTRIKAELELYDAVIIPMRLNVDVDFLQKIQDKSRVTLFANAGCAFNCPSKLCYPSISKINKFTGAVFKCSKLIKPREEFGMIDFDLAKLSSLGFHRFKLLRGRPGGITGY